MAASKLDKTRDEIQSGLRRPLGTATRKTFYYFSHFLTYSPKRLANLRNALQ